MPKGIKKRRSSVSKRIRQQVRDLEDRLKELRGKLKELDSIREQLQRDLESARDFGDSMENQDIENLRSELFRLNIEREKLLTRINKLNEELNTLLATKPKKDEIDKTLLKSGSPLRDILIKDIINTDFELTYLDEKVKSVYGIEKIKLRFVTSDEYVDLSNPNKLTISLESPIGLALLDKLKDELKKEFIKHLLQEISERKVTVVAGISTSSTKVKRKTKTGKVRKQSVPGQSGKKLSTKQLKELVTSLADATFLTLDRQLSVYSQNFKQAYRALNIDIPDDIVDKALIMALSSSSKRTRELTVNLPELGPTKLKLRTL